MFDTTFLTDMSKFDKQIEMLRPNKSRCLMLWEVRDNMHCSIVGTCLSRADVLLTIRRAKMRKIEESTDYDVHSWFVCEVTKSGIISKFAHKLLDKKFATAIRKHMQIKSRSDIIKNWNEARRSGSFAGTYWAIASDPRTDDELRRRVFGEVHMLSHYMIGKNRLDAHTVNLAEERIAQLEGRLARVRAQHAQALQARDERIANLEQETLEMRAALVRQSMLNGLAGQENKSLPRLGQCSTAKTIDGYRRKITSARALLKESRAENATLKQKIGLLLEDPWIESHQTDNPGKTVQPQRSEAVPSVDDRHQHWLYVGGRSANYPHLRRGAAAFCGKLVFHDGGIEQSLRTLDDLVPQVEIVFCPVDCISHSACLRAKRLCRQFKRTFVPLRSASSSHFRTIASRVLVDREADIH